MGSIIRAFLDMLAGFAEMVKRAVDKVENFSLDGQTEGTKTVTVIRDNVHIYYCCSLTHKPTDFKFKFGVILKNDALTPKQELYFSFDKFDKGKIDKTFTQGSAFFEMVNPDREEPWFTVQEPHNSDFFSDATDDKAKEALLVDLFTELDKLLMQLPGNSASGVK
jgi:hypothetical protein